MSGAPLTVTLGSLVLGKSGLGCSGCKAGGGGKIGGCLHLFFLWAGFVVPVQICGLLACRFCLCFVGCGSGCLGGWAQSGFCGFTGLAGRFPFRAVLSAWR
ncbi:hypothetical protein [Methylovulum sp.]|uniref:hypothetical protein n=1 Tax=Methylovulum sp. TaxID=1916980 RepID=UPI002622E58A|nr:hypothetical protein [Methylovulum sp.]MDD5125022.1 hypothetical protein [Methylovulum sp.]